MRRRFVRWLALIVALVLVIWLAITALFAFNLYQTINNARVRLQMLPSANAVRQSVIDVSAAAGQFSTVLLPVGAAARLAGADGCVIANLLTTGSQLAAYGEQYADLAAAIYNAQYSLSANAVDVTAVRAAWSPDAAESLRATVAGLRDLPACDGASERFARLDHAADGSLTLLDALVTLPWDFVLRDSARWIVALNNTDEIRGTGGFTTAVITFWVEGGLLRWTFGNSYSVDNLDRLYYHPNPPLPMQQFMAIHRLMFRDANWSPDYPTTAATALRVYQLDQQLPLDGMVTVNMTALPVAVAALPPITLNGQPLTPDSSLDLLRSAWNEGATTYNSDAPERKQFIAETMTQLAQAVIGQVNPLDLAAAGVVLDDLFARRDLMVYAADADLQAVFAARGWDGGMIPVEGDYLMVVDSNLGYNKVTPRVTTAVDYAVTLGATPAARLRLHYDNTNTEPVPCSVVYLGWERNPEDIDTPTQYGDRMTACFWNYVRAFVPPGAHLTGFAAANLPADWFPYSPTANPAHVDAWHEAIAGNFGYDGFGTMTITPPGETRDAEFRYHLPPGVVRTESGDSVYTLFVQRQAGSAFDNGSPKPLTVTVTLPDGSALVSANPEPTAVSGGQITFATDLALDRAITVRYRP